MNDTHKLLLALIDKLGYEVELNTRKCRVTGKIPELSYDTVISEAKLTKKSKASTQIDWSKRLEYQTHLMAMNKRDGCLWCYKKDGSFYDSHTDQLMTSLCHNDIIATRGNEDE